MLRIYHLIAKVFTLNDNNPEIKLWNRGHWYQVMNDIEHKSFEQSAVVLPKKFEMFLYSLTGKRNVKRLELTYAVDEESKVHAISVTHFPDTFNRKIGVKVVTGRIARMKEIAGLYASLDLTNPVQKDVIKYKEKNITKTYWLMPWIYWEGQPYE